MDSKKLLTKEFKRDILGKKYRVQVDEESQKHDSHCLLFVIPFKQRTPHSCSCSENKTFRENFITLRKSS